jgi:hypothetical protein
MSGKDGGDRKRTRSSPKSECPPLDTWSHDFKVTLVPHLSLAWLWKIPILPPSLLLPPASWSGGACFVGLVHPANFSISKEGIMCLRSLRSHWVTRPVVHLPPGANQGVFNTPPFGKGAEGSEGVAKKKNPPQPPHPAAGTTL